MDNHYTFPPPEIIYLTSAPIVSSPQFSPSASLPSSNGDYRHPHPLCYPQHQPGMMYTPHQYSPISPQANYPPDVRYYNYPHGYNYGNPSYHPGLPVPPPPPPPPPALPQAPEDTTASSFADNLQLDEFWRGRLAPLPGYQSRPGLLPLKETKQIQIGVPTKTQQEPGSGSKLLPPHSFFGKDYQKIVPPVQPILTNNNTNTEASSVTHRFIWMMTFRSYRK